MKQKLNVNAYTSLASHSCVKSFVLQHEDEAENVIFNKLTSVFHASVRLLIMNFVLTLSK